MFLVPLELAMVALSQRALQRAGPSFVKVGGRTEMDLDLLEDADDALRVRRYLSLSRSMPPPLDRSSAAQLDVVLVDAKQSTTKSSQKDLTSELFALGTLPGTRTLLAALDSDPPTHVSGLRMEVLDGGLARASVRISAPIWPLELGGPPSPMERSRMIRITASHAAWRDRRSRRLVRVEAISRQLWPLPR